MYGRMYGGTRPLRMEGTLVTRKDSAVRSKGQGTNMY